MKHYLLPLTVAVLLAGCGGGGGQSVDPVAAANEAANTASSGFFASILNLVNGTSDTNLPVSVDSIAAGASETQSTNPL